MVYIHFFLIPELKDLMLFVFVFLVVVGLWTVI